MSFADLRQEVAELFADCQGDYEAALYRAHQFRVAQRRETRKLDHAGRARARRRQKAYSRLITAQLKAIRAARPPIVIDTPVPPLPKHQRRARIKQMHTYQKNKARRVGRVA